MKFSISKLKGKFIPHISAVVQCVADIITSWSNWTPPTKFPEKIRGYLLHCNSIELRRGHTFCRNATQLELKGIKLYFVATSHVEQALFTTESGEYTLYNWAYWGKDNKYLLKTLPILYLLLIMLICTRNYLFFKHIQRKSANWIWNFKQRKYKLLYNSSNHHLLTWTWGPGSCLLTTSTGRSTPLTGIHPGREQSVMLNGQSKQAADIVSIHSNVKVYRHVLGVGGHVQGRAHSCSATMSERPRYFNKFI